MMDTSVKECYTEMGGRQHEESLSLRDTTKVDHKGVTGGDMKNSIGVGLNNGVVSSHHNHGDTYNIIMMEQARKSFEMEKYSYGEQPVHRSRTKDRKSFSLCVDNLLPKSSSPDDSPDEFHDCISTPSPHPPEVGDTKLPFGDKVDCLPTPSSLSSHLGVKRPSMGDFVAMLKNMNLADSDGDMSRFGIQMREILQESDDICLNRNGTKCVPPSDTTPSRWNLGSCSTDEFVLIFDLKTVPRERRLIAKYIITDNVFIGEYYPNEAEKIYFFIHDLYIERLSCKCPERLLSDDGLQTTDTTETVRIDLKNITCDIIRSKIRESADKIVFLARVSLDVLNRISKNLSETLFGLRRKDIEPT